MLKYGNDHDIEMKSNYDEIENSWWNEVLKYELLEMSLWYWNEVLNIQLIMTLKYQIDYDEIRIYICTFVPYVH